MNRLSVCWRDGLKWYSVFFNLRHEKVLLLDVRLGLSSEGAFNECCDEVKRENRSVYEEQEGQES